MESTRTVPEIGVHKNIPPAEYHAWDALSNSWLQRFARSPAHLKSYLDSPDAPTPAMTFGRAVHSCVLTPGEYAQEFVQGPEGDRRTKAVREQWAALALKVPPGNILKPVDALRIYAIRNAIWANKSAAKLLGGEGDAELSVVWDQDDIRCKARADRVSYKLAGGTIVDLKTTTDARREAFERKIFSLGYHCQGAWYMAAFLAHKIPIRHYTIIAVEVEPPFGVAVYRLTEPAIDAGWKQIEPLLDTYRKCRVRNEWPGYPDKVADIGLPAWAWSQIEPEATA